MDKVDILTDNAHKAKRDAERLIRKRFQRRYGAFYKCDCGNFLGYEVWLLDPDCGYCQTSTSLAKEVNYAPMP